ncbi:MAG: hypothetical protein ACOCZ6_04355 [Nanoarchaeota archaeon]
MNKRGFVMWRDFLKGMGIGLIVGIVVLVLVMLGVIPVPIDACGMLCGTAQ